jgi:predicted metal-dependent hydrolase
VPHDITVRRPLFEFPDSLDPLTCAGPPEESCLNIAISLLLPFLEPYLIRSMKSARPLLTDDDLIADLEKFNAQEGQHYRQHRLFNDAVRRSGFPGLARFEAEIDADYQRFTHTRSLRFNLAYAEGFEALTMNVARFSMEQRRADHYAPVVRDLFLWHLIEELEHRTVAFDIYNRVCHNWPYRLIAGTYAQMHMLRWCLRVAVHLLVARKDVWRAQHGGLWGAAKRLAPLAWKQLWFLTPKLIATYLPWYSPGKIPMPIDASAFSAEFYQRTGGTNQGALALLAATTTTTTTTTPALPAPCR